MLRSFYKTEILVLVLSYYLIIVGANEAIQAKKAAAVDKLRQEVKHLLIKDFMKTDVYLLRWLKDSKYDLNAAKEKLVKALEWRKENNIDNIRQEDLSKLEQLCTYTLDGHDKENRPIILFPVGKCNFQRILVNGNLEKVHRISYRILEDFEEAIHKGSGDQGLIIADYTGFNLRQHGCLRCIPFFLTLFQLYDEYYPGILKATYHINVPRSINALREVLRPFASQNLRDIVKIYGYDQSEWKPELLRLIDPDQLPTAYGGTRGTINGNKKSKTKN